MRQKDHMGHKFKSKSYILICSSLLFFSWSLATASSAVTRDDAKRYQKLSALGLSQYRGKDYPAAQKSFAGAASLLPGDPSVHYYLGMSAFHNNDFVLSREELSKVVVMSSPASRFYKNAIKCFSDYKNKFERVRPYSCAEGEGKYFRWSQRAMPLKIFISHGLKLPRGYREKELSGDKLNALSRWLADKSYVAKIRRDSHYDDSFWNAARSGVAEWSFARADKLIDFDLTGDIKEADILIFWCSKLEDGSSATTVLPTKAGERAIIQIAVDWVLAKQAHHRADLVRHITAHELGHALGLKNSDFNRDIMFPVEKVSGHKTGFNPGGSNKVSHNDATTLKALYSLPDMNTK